ncbi:hypothetical protein [Labilibaculum sp.]|uniref:hypothetical protein n=1 Tax=Labilibaculum sp. TaxID=2060723 RepID=UPI00356B0330
MKQNKMKGIILVVVLLLSGIVNAQLKTEIGQADFSDWKGISKVKNAIATFKNRKVISYEYSNCNRVYPGLMRDFYGDAADFSIYSGLSFDLFLKAETMAEVSLVLKVDSLDINELNPVNTANLCVSGQGWQKVYIPWELLDVNVGQRGNTLQAIKKVEICVKSKDNSSYQIKNLQLTKGELISANAKVLGRSAKGGENVSYEFEVGNTTDKKQGVQLKLETLGWESMNVALTPSNFELAPNETKVCKLEVSIPKSLPQGIREKQTVKIIPNGKGSSVQKLVFTTAVEIPTPNLVFTADKWQDVKDKIGNYDWAKEALAEYEEKASSWEVPEGNKAVRNKQIFNKGEGDRMYDCGVAWQLTGNKLYVKKALKLLRRLTSLENGYPVTLHGGGNSFVAEGVFFQGVARSYDMIRDCDLLTDEDHKLIENTFRIFIDRTIKANTRGGISNWNVAEITGALYCALALQDWNSIEWLLESPTGIYKQIAHGVMSDGWWYECAVGYNLWVASEFSEIAIALQPWGINLKDMQVPIGTTPHFSLNPSRRVGGLHGMQFMKWGTIQKNNIGIKDMWDAVIPFLDYRGVLPAVNDAKEDMVTGKPYELAYYLYRDPEYAAVINRGTKRDLLYGVPDLPSVTSEKMKQSAYADNIGLVQLRSQSKGREQKDQIQAALHYGSHGGHHGHFDRTNFISMMRYGRSFYNPEMYWYGYASYLYKFLVQTSINKNMVVVDQKMQEPKESFKTLFYTGDMMQATAVETNTRWSYPPYGGMIYSSQHDIDFPEKMWLDGKSIEIPEDRPEYGLCTDYTDPVLQRRLMIMMDDYIVLADYLESDQEHTFDWLMQVKGFKGITADEKEYVRHDNQMSTDPLGSSQFIIDCDWYKTTGTSRTSFVTRWGEGADNEGARMPFSEDGELKMDIFNAWPQQNEVMIGTAPESFRVSKQLWYSVIADDKTILNDSTGAWILGSKQINVDIKGKSTLVLVTKTPGRKSNNTIFWGDAKVILKDGSEVFVSDLPVQYKNVEMPKTKGLDYYDGPIKIAGELMVNSTPANPENTNEEAVITVDLSGIEAVSFRAKLGGDFPLGDETQRRKTMAVRSKGKTARYLSVVEPYETEPLIKSVKAVNANKLVVELKDGRVQEISISELEGDGKHINVSVKEMLDGVIIREEQIK